MNYICVVCHDERNRMEAIEKNLFIIEKKLTELESKMRIMNDGLGNKISHLGNLLDARWQEGIEFKDQILAECKRIEKPILEYIDKIEKKVHQLDNAINHDIMNIHTRLAQLEESNLSNSTPLEPMKLPSCIHGLLNNCQVCDKPVEQKKKGLTFAEAMKCICEGKTVAKSKYHFYRADSITFKYPRVIIANEENEQSGYWIPTLRDIEATDWRVVE